LARPSELLAQPLEGFLENRGQLDAAVRYYRAGPRGSVYFTGQAVVLEIVGAPEPSDSGMGTPDARAREQRPRHAARRHALRLVFEGARHGASVEGAGRLPGRQRFLLGGGSNRPTEVPAFAEVLYRDLWPGIDLVFSSRAGELSYRVLAREGADVGRVRFRHEGGDRVRSTADAEILDTPAAMVLIERPSGPGREGSIRLSEPLATSDAVASAALAAQAPDRLGWSSFLGGARDEAVHALAVDTDGQIVVVGAARSPDFPTTSGALEPSHRGSFDAFAARFSADGTTLLWSTFLGGSLDDRAWAVALDGSGRPVIAGVTGSVGFPVTAGAFDESQNGSYDAFVTCLEADGSALVWSTLLGGAGSEWDVSGLQLDPLGRATIVGSTRSGDFPTTAGAYDEDLGGAQDAFIARLTVGGTALDFATLLGGAGLDSAEDVALDASGRPVIVGRTYSPDFPIPAGAFQETFAGTPDLPEGFVARLSSGGDALEMATFLGGSLDDEAFAVAIDPAQRPVVAGSTGSIDFPTTPGAFSRTYAGNRDAFVARLEADGSGLVWSTLLGGGGGESGLDVVLSARNHPVVTGWTCSEDFPVAGAAFDDTFRGPCDAFVTSFGSAGSHLTYSTFLGGWYDESGYALALDAYDRPILGGETLSSDFPTTATAYDPDHASPDERYDGFVLRLSPQVVCVSVSGASTPELSLGKAPGPGCPPGVPEGQAIDLVEGRLEDLAASAIAVVDPVRCGSADVVFATDTLPAPGHGLFLLARYAPLGSYADGAGPGLVGTRVVEIGDCP